MRKIGPNEIKELQMSILDVVHDYCIKNGFMYFMMCGTLLGAVRHGGYIPWDDDIDIAMFRDDYDKFISGFNAEHSDYRVYSIDNTPGYNLFFAKISNEKTLYVDDNIIYHDTDIGVNIDLFPIDKLPETANADKILKKLHFLDKLQYCKASKKGRALLKKQKIKIILGKLLAAPMSKRGIGVKCDTIARKYNKADVNTYSFISYGIRNKLPIYTKDLFDPIELQFEDRKYMAPSGYDIILQSFYGDYMTLPPKSKQISNHAYSAYWKEDKMLVRELSLQELHAMQLEMLSKFDTFCETQGLNYFLAHGTLLGAVRHKGFIPWDDDVDILMPRPDYDKLLQYNKISDNCLIVSHLNEQGYYHPFTYANLCNTDTIMAEHQMKRQTSKGVFLDVFPLDGCPNSKLICKNRILHLRVLSMVLRLKTVATDSTSSTIRSIIEKIVLLFYRAKSEYGIIDKIIKIATKCGYHDHEMTWIGTFLVKDASRNTYPRINFEGYRLCQFEDKFFRIPIGYDDCLLRSYGDYMKLPAETDRVAHHEIKYFWKTDD